jgi:hypothetical protein
LRDADRHRGSSEEPPGLDDLDAVACFDVRAQAGITDQHGDLVPGLDLRFGERLDVVFDAAQDGEVVFVNV